MPEKHRVLILGGGFAGLVAAQTLKQADAQVTLIDKRNFHLFQPLLYQVATGSLSPGEIAAPLRSVLSRQKNVQVLLGEAADIDPDARQVTLLDGGVFPYGSLIIATGSETSYYGNDSWREEAPSLKTIEEATVIRHKILFAFERAERAETEKEARAWLTLLSWAAALPVWSWLGRWQKSRKRHCAMTSGIFIRRSLKYSCWTGVRGC
jgi:NADH dehydrogenase